MLISENEFVFACSLDKGDYMFFKKMFNRSTIEKNLKEKYESILFKFTDARRDLLGIDMICDEVENYFFPERFKADYDINDNKFRGVINGSVSLVTQQKRNSDNN